MQSLFFVVSQFGFGVDDAAAVVTTAFFTVVKPSEVWMQLKLVCCPISVLNLQRVLEALISNRSFMSFLRDIKTRVRLNK